MSKNMTVRFDDETARQLSELAETTHTTKVAAIQCAVHDAWVRLQYEKLDAGYAAAVAENPHYPYESAEEAAVRRNRRAARDSRRAS
jgi:predicted transcriptional regulator